MILKFRRWLASMMPVNRQNHDNLPLAAVLLGQQKLGLLLLDGQRQQVLQVESVLLSAGQTPEQAVEQLVSAIPQQAALVLVLPAERYQLLLLDKPALPEAEICQALPWLAKDLLNWPLDDLVLDYLDDVASAQSKIAVVASQKSYLVPICQLLQYRHRQLRSIVPDEWLALHLLPRQPQPVLVLAQPYGQDLTVQIVRDGQCYVSRKLRGFNRLTDYSLTELTGGMLDSLLLEVQRSMDYFEAQLRQAPVRQIKLLLNTPELGGIIDYFRQQGFAQVQPLALDHWMGALDPAQQHEYWLLLAATLGLQQEMADEAQR